MSEGVDVRGLDFNIENALHLLLQTALPHLNRQARQWLADGAVEYVTRQQVAQVNACELMALNLQHTALPDAMERATVASWLEMIALNTRTLGALSLVGQIARHEHASPNIGTAWETVH